MFRKSGSQVLKKLGGEQADGQAAPKPSSAGFGLPVAVAVTCGCLVVMVLSSACGLLILPEHERTVVGMEVKSPDGVIDALVVEQYQNNAIHPYEEFVLVAPSDTDVHKAMKDKNRAKYLVMWVSGPANIAIQWRERETLLVSCKACNLTTRELHMQVYQVGSTNVVYEGFPTVPRNP